MRRTQLFARRRRLRPSCHALRNKSLGAAWIRYGTCLYSGAPMLRLYRHYVPSIVFAMIATDLAILTLSVTSARHLGYWSPDGALWLKAAIVAGVTLLALYL